MAPAAAVAETPLGVTEVSDEVTYVIQACLISRKGCGDVINTQRIAITRSC